MRQFHKTFSIALILCFAMPIVASAQGGAGDLRGRKTRTNYYRQVGGSCIYDRYGELSYAPAGAECSKKENESKDGSTNRVSAALEAELDRYRLEHHEIDEALADLRDTIADREYKQATQLLDTIKVKLLSHKRREEMLFDRLEPSSPASPATTDSAKE